MTTLLAFIPAVLGLSLLALSMSRHHRDLLGKQPSRITTLVLRLAGWMSVAISLVAAIVIEGAVTGTVLWIGILTVAAQVVALLLTYRDRWCRI